MMHIFMNSLAASAGGGLTYVRNIVPQFAVRTDVRLTAALSSNLRREFDAAPNIDFLELGVPNASRFWYEQRVLPEWIRKSGASVLLSTGNFALRSSPVPQILLSRNSLYLSRDFFRDLVARGEYRMWVDTHMRAFLAKRSVCWANATVAPSRAFARELEKWTGVKVFTIHHGFDKGAFGRDGAALPAHIQRCLDSVRDSLKILFVSHYNYYRNFETLIRALPGLRSRLTHRAVRLLLTCKLAPGMNPGTYRAESVAGLVRELGVADMVVELGAIPYQSLHQLYKRADLYVTPAYAETFAHPLVEAMASGVPIVASDIPVHREICGDAAVYFERFSPEALVDSILQVADEKERLKSMVEKGRVRADRYSWKAHVEQIIELARLLVQSPMLRHSVQQDDRQGQ